MYFFFNFILLNLYFFNFLILIPFIICFFYFWVFFIKNNFNSVRIQPSYNDILKNSKVLKKINYLFFINWFIPFILYINLSFFFIKYDYIIFWFNHLKLNNFLINIILIIFIINIIIINSIKFYKNNNINYNIDYFFSIFNLSIFIPLLFLSNTFYTFFFLLELNSVIILYKFVVSKFWLKKNSFFQFNKNFLERVISKSYLNVIFFQYWANFFSTILIMFSIFNTIYIYGSSDWFFLNLINYINYNLSLEKNSNFFLILWFVFFFGFFLKIGFTPLHLFKIEVYKGIPFISIFFYTTFYFLSFFLYFIILSFYNLNSFKLYWWFFFLIFLLLGSFYIIFLLFDVNLIKSFFAYSTSINVLLFIIILISSF